MPVEFGENNVAEQLWGVYFEKFVKGIVTEAGRIQKIKEGFYHGLYCGSNMVLKATKLPHNQCEIFITGFREQIKQGIRARGQGHFEGQIHIQDKPLIIPSTRLPRNGS